MRWVAPEAIIDAQGRLRLVDPATEGKDLLCDLLKAGGWLPDSEPSDEWYMEVALPSQVRFIPTDSLVHLYPRYFEEPRQPVPWEEIQPVYGALLVLDETSVPLRVGVSVVCTREPLRRWSESLGWFPSSKTSIEWLGLNDSRFNRQLRTISPYAFVGEDGTLQRGWHCRSLLQAMYLMLYLDLSGGNTIKKCQSRGCPNSFRVGSQSKSKYCSQRCANRASTRMRRGQEP
jgi:hypothetical protein